MYWDHDLPSFGSDTHQHNTIFDTAKVPCGPILLMIAWTWVNGWGVDWKHKYKSVVIKFWSRSSSSETQSWPLPPIHWIFSCSSALLCAAATTTPPWSMEASSETPSRHKKKEFFKRGYSIEVVSFPEGRKIWKAWYGLGRWGTFPLLWNQVASWCPAIRFPSICLSMRICAHTIA